MKFVEPNGDPEHIQAVRDLDNLVQDLCSLDVEGRRLAQEGDVERGSEVAMQVGSSIAGLTWGTIPTVIMHFAGHVNMARADSARMAEVCQSTADGLTCVSQLMSEAGAPVELCAKLMDLAVELRKAGEDGLFEVAECLHE